MGFVAIRIHIGDLVDWHIGSGILGGVSCVSRTCRFDFLGGGEWQYFGQRGVVGDGAIFARTLFNPQNQPQSLKLFEKMGGVVAVLGVGADGGRYVADCGGVVEIECLGVYADVVAGEKFSVWNFVGWVG